MAESAEDTAAQNTTPNGRPPLRVVLCRTTHPGNIGASARAMKAMGLSELVLVAPKAGIFPSEEATARAVSAADILESARVVDTLDEALADCVWVAGTTARKRHIGPPVVTPREFAEDAVERVRDAPVALVFGQERTGLSNDEVDRCHCLVRIPTGQEFASLNLGAAVQILTYEWQLTLPPPESGRPPRYRSATAAEYEGYFGHLAQVIGRTGYFAQKNQPAVLRRLRTLYQRAALDTNEINILRGFLTSIEKALDGAEPRD